MDIFIEQIVARRPSPKDNIIKIGLVSGMLLLSGLLLTVAVTFSELAFICFSSLASIPGIFWLGTYFLKGLTTEYEYILTNKELDIDKITGRRNRRRMVTLDLKNAEKFAPCGKNFLVNDTKCNVTVSAHDNSYVNMWYLIVKHDSHGKVILLFNPDDSFVEKLNNALSPRIRHQE